MSDQRSYPGATVNAHWVEREDGSSELWDTGRLICATVPAPQRYHDQHHGPVIFDHNVQYIGPNVPASPEQLAQWKAQAKESGPTREALGLPYLRHLPLEALAAAAASFEYGANKYEARNWEKAPGLPYQQMIDSLRRHLDDFERGVEVDESGLHQTCMIMASAMMLCASVVRGIGIDDRTKLLPDSKAMSAKDCAKWIESQLKNTVDTAQKRVYFED